MKTKTGENLYRDEDGKLWFATSYCDENGAVETVSVELKEDIDTEAIIN